MNKIIKSIALIGLSAVFSTAILAQKSPNILCIVCEDISPYLGCYSDPVAQSPNIDRLASEGIRFTRMFTPVGVCAPSRAALITGMYPTSIGANNMRNYSPDPAYKAIPSDINLYEVVLPEGVKCYTEYMRTAGYYCTNNNKTDYQFASPLTAWDENGKNAHWKNRPHGKPFFSIFNLEVTHESQIWQRGSNPLAVNPAKVPLPPYYPDDPVVRHDMAVLYSNIKEMDNQVQKLIDEVTNAGLLDSTIIIFYSDNGGPMPRQKRTIYESGTLVPFMVRYPDGYRKGEVDTRLCSFIDIPATILSLVGVEPPKYIQGKAFLGKYQAPPRKYIFGARNRMDEQIDKQGYVRDSRYRYVHNYMPEKSNYMPVAYRLNMPMMRRMLELHDHDSLNDAQEQWFKAPRPSDEFYDVDNDPAEIHNLISNPAYSNEIVRLKKAYKKWDNKYNKMWKLPEKECRELFWPEGKQPVAEMPEFTETTKGLVLKSKTKGVSFAYQVNGQGYNKSHWFLYTGPVPVRQDDVVSAVSVRAGYKNSGVSVFHKAKN